MVKILYVDDRTHDDGLKIKTSAIVAGAVASLCVVSAYYPIDTITTRLQSSQGFYKAGGFRGLYKGFLTMTVGAVPSNSLFFGTYETSKHYLQPFFEPEHAPLVHMGCATACRLLMCIFRVPIEIAVQRQQVCLRPKTRSAIAILIDAYNKEGVCRGLYRGFASTLLRDLPYSFIELPTWELLKSTVRQYNDEEITVFQSASCGVCASAFATLLTTPCDVIQTRVMLHQHHANLKYEQLRIKQVISAIYAESGIRGLFAGLIPRVLGISGGRFLFFLVFEETTRKYEEFMGDTRLRS